MKFLFVIVLLLVSFPFNQAAYDLIVTFIAAVTKTMSAAKAGQAALDFLQASKNQWKRPSDGEHGIYVCAVNTVVNIRNSEHRVYSPGRGSLNSGLLNLEIKSGQCGRIGGQNEGAPSFKTYVKIEGYMYPDSKSFTYTHGSSSISAGKKDTMLYREDGRGRMGDVWHTGQKYIAWERDGYIRSISVRETRTQLILTVADEHMASLTSRSLFGFELKSYLDPNWPSKAKWIEKDSSCSVM